METGLWFAQSAWVSKNPIVLLSQDMTWGNSYWFMYPVEMSVSLDDLDENNWRVQQSVLHSIFAYNIDLSNVTDTSNQTSS